MADYRKKLIEVALPLAAINEGSKPETENPFLKGHPRAVHNWWARTPLSVSRAILFAQLIDDPGDGLPTKEARKAREKLLDFISKLSTWQATTDENLIKQARDMISAQFNGNVPEFWDMFGGRASIPLEAQRLGLKVTSSDLNPVAVTIQRALLEFPSKFRDRPSVHPEEGRNLFQNFNSKTDSGLREDILWYAEWVRKQAEKKLSKLYPDGPKGEKIIAWLWARTVKCPNPACGARTPLIGSFILSKKSRILAEPKPDLNTQTVEFEIKTGSDPHEPTSNRSGAKCLFCDTRMKKRQLRNICCENGIDIIPFVLVCDGKSTDRFQVFKDQSFLDMHELDVEFLQQPMTEDKRWFSPPLYGLPNFADLFTTRQKIALTCLSDLITEAHKTITKDGKGDEEYADAVTFYLACALSRLTDYSNSLCTWNPTNENVRDLFQRQAIPMVWDFVEANPIYGKLSYTAAAEWVARSLEAVPVTLRPARVLQKDARKSPPQFEAPPVISTDPPYYDNIGYADLSDFFYVWLRKVLRQIDPQTFSTLLSPKEPELIASPHRHNGSSEKAERHFREGFALACANMHDISNTEVPITVYYAFKQQEVEATLEDTQRSSTGWETMLEGLIDSGFQITGTWPVRTTKKARSVARGTNALASAVVLVARQRKANAPMATRKDFAAELREELPLAFAALTEASIAPVDLAQAAIGPGMAVFSKYSKIIEADGSQMSVRTALQIINQELDTHLAAQEGELDRETSWAVAWFEQNGMNEGEFGEAETLSRAKNTAVNSLVDARIVTARSGKVCLIPRTEMSEDWNPTTDPHLTVWEATQHLIRTLDRRGESGAATLLSQVGEIGGLVRDLAYRLFSICERKGWTTEALAYNSIVLAWPEISKLALSVPKAGQQNLFE